jgi:hypothetical protein
MGGINPMFEMASTCDVNLDVFELGWINIVCIMLQRSMASMH